MKFNWKIISFAEQSDQNKDCNEAVNLNKYFAQSYTSVKIVAQSLFPIFFPGCSLYFTQKRLPIFAAM